MITPNTLRQRSYKEVANFPPLLARAKQLAGTVLLGEHGRRRAGLGDDFWQYRPAQIGDGARNIDWRRSARSDDRFVREREWKIAQTVMFWIDSGASMSFSSNKNLGPKSERAQIIALAVALLLVRGGERVGLIEQDLPAQCGETQIRRMANILCQPGKGDFGAPPLRGLLPNTNAVFISDFMGDFAAVESAVFKAADTGTRGALLQILDPAEEAFPFKGRTIFESMGQTIRHETLKAADLKNRYLERLRERKMALADLCAITGWQYNCHHTDTSAQSALLWIYRALDQVSIYDGGAK